MTVRSRFADGMVIYAGTCDELAAVADKYACGSIQRPAGCHPSLFTRAAELLRTGHYPAISLGDVRFYRDHPSGRPFAGPFAPDPSDAWERQQSRNAPVRA